ncbi:MAG: DoxX family protein [Bacteroidales bacterium]|nr:DoxX family protein [Bacteroidales bacterium]
MKVVRILARYIVGIVFIVSGFLKGVDPVGTSLKVKEYFHAFLNLDPGHWALWIGIALCAVEFLTGVCILKVIKFRFFSGLALLMCIFFAGVTFYSAYTGKVSDCGCFGDVIHLDPWPSFYKNLVLLALTIFLYSQRHRARPIASNFWEWAFLFGYAAFIVGVSLYSMRNLPPADLSDFKPGRDLFKGDSTSMVKYKTEILYSKDGVTKKFSLNHLPDTSWKYVETISTVIEGSERIAHKMPFLLKDSAGEDVTESVLRTEGPVIFISFYDADGITDDDLGKLKNLGDSLKYGSRQSEVYVLSAMTPEQTMASLKPISDAIEKEDISDVFSASHSDLNLPFKIVYGDFKTIVTFNRSNGGATYVNQGLIVHKWSAAKYNNKRILSAISKNPTALMTGTEEHSRLFLIISLAIIVGMVLIVRFISKALYKTVKHTVEVIEEIGEDESS